MASDNSLYIIKDRLRSAMDSSGLNATELSALCNVQRSSISRYLKGTVIPKPGAIEAMAKALGVSATWLLGYSDSMHIEECPVRAMSDNIIDISKLSTINQAKLVGYYQALLDTQDK